MTGAPGHLSAGARRAWDEIEAGLQGGLDGVEAMAVESYAVAVARMRDAQSRVDLDGLIVPDDKGRPVPHPALAVERAAAAEVKRWVERYRPRPPRPEGRG